MIGELEKKVRRLRRPRPIQLHPLLFLVSVEPCSFRLPPTFAPSAYPVLIDVPVRQASATQISAPVASPLPPLSPAHPTLVFSRGVSGDPDLQ
jgi:hypothetical protein